ncbi:MAG: ATP-binding protein [Acidimicrobiales bacterium]
MKRSAIGTVAMLSSMALLTGAMIPLRGHLAIATAALVLVVPVVVGVVIGGFVAGTVGVLAGFLVYDFCFIPPFETLSVKAGQDWVALGVYAVVMLPVAKVVGNMNAARTDARRQGKEIRQLFDLTDLLVEDKPLQVLLAAVVTTFVGVFGSRQVALLLPHDGRLEVAASAGERLTKEELDWVVPPPGAPASVRSPRTGPPGLLVLALVAAGRPIGLLVLSGDVAARHEREPLLLFANHIALAVERAQLREEALRTRLTEEMSRLARTLIAAVSHDLRTPLASIKASSSTLADPDLALGPHERERLAGLIDAQADRLAELVRDLLDMSRIQAGVLRPRCRTTALPLLIGKVVDDLTPALHGHDVHIEMSDDLPLIDVDAMLISRVLTNLVENAIRHGPKQTPIAIGARLVGETTIELSVTDSGSGFGIGHGDEVFELFARRQDDVGIGLGLTIAKTFVEAHGQRIWVENAPESGVRFCFTLPAALPSPEGVHEERTVVADSHS